MRLTAAELKQFSRFFRGNTGLRIIVNTFELGVILDCIK